MSSAKKIGIIGLGSYLPKKILANCDLEKMVDTSDEWITTRTGIKQRRIASKDEATSDLAIKAARAALKDAGLTAKDLDLIIVATITPDMQFPATACLVQKNLGADKAICFDISAACSGFVYALVTAEQFIISGVCKNALIIGAEKLSSITDWTDRNTCVLFGDGAGACVLAKVNSGGIVSRYLGSDGMNSDLLLLPAGGSRMPASSETVKKHLHFIKMQGNELFKLAVRIMSKAAEVALSKIGLSCKDIDILIPHQANIRILLAVAKKMGLPEKKIYFNIEKYGNMSSAATVIALCEAVRSKRIKKGDIVVLDAFGAGLTWGAVVIKW
ncbi:MAG: 3-oxoacyl-ACP synthase [Candidatus Omnitrophica bacterium CG11_big_fil_rev_8_21_14_0_20_42_13]|uniref:Beta-ketoacyl-[acyl-carrier-protein] synthase III n=1 Tax=Candidatus Ghiorseimicrobium undicola TaxID=1974746 RepID=A0A2H0LVZ3_9BACT|nr:MAG: 3-oxoacyl-ACP synthase [Candidatus Omnitrophica bacterium CG11_big_fil_rev_8_21_14_0_20_42_13]